MIRRSTGTYKCRYTPQPTPRGAYKEIKKLYTSQQVRLVIRVVRSRQPGNRDYIREPAGPAYTKIKINFIIHRRLDLTRQ